MTTVTRPVIRQTAVIVRDGRKMRPLVLMIFPDRIGFRPKGTRTYYVPIQQCYVLAVQAHVDAVRSAKMRRKK